MIEFSLQQRGVHGSLRQWMRVSRSCPVANRGQTSVDFVVVKHPRATRINRDRHGHGIPFYNKHLESISSNRFRFQ